MCNQLVYDPLPVGKGHLMFQALGVATDVAFLAPLSAHLAAQVAVVGDGQGDALREGRDHTVPA